MEPFSGITNTDIHFWKVEGAGNDFVVFDLRSGDHEKLLNKIGSQAFVESVSKQKFGVGSDGVVILKEADNQGADFAWEFYNTDGSRAEMCGNAARCIGLVGSEITGKEGSVNIQTDVGPIKTQKVGENTIEVEMFIKEPAPQEFDVGLMEGTNAAWFINTGVPHIVIDRMYWPVRKEIKPKIKSLRSHPSLGEAGANVTLFNRLKDGNLQAVTFERGVEDYTLSCGTGVLAAGLVELSKTGKDTIDVTNPGGTLNVRIDSKNQSIYLTGPARYVFRGQLNKEFFEL